MSDHGRGCEGRNYICTCGYDDRLEARATAAEAENVKLREALAEELAWHEGEAKALSKQPRRPELEWPKHHHRERIEAITAVLETDNG